MHTVGRWALRVPDGSDGPPNVPLWMDRLAVDLTDVAKDNQGTLAARPASTVVAPGTSGRYFTTTDEDDPAGVDRRRVYRDAGTAWDELATVPVSRRMLDAALSRTIPTGLLTVAQFLALPAQPDGTEVLVQIVVPTASVPGLNLRLRLNGLSAHAAKWEVLGESPELRGEATAGAAAITGAGSTAYVTPSTAQTLTLPLAGVVEVYAYSDQFAVIPPAAATSYGLLSYSVGATAASDADAAIGYTPTTDAHVETVQSTPSRKSVAAGDVITPKAKALTTTTTVNVNNGSGHRYGVAAKYVAVSGPAAL